jgi:hypothetical protein
MKRLNLILVLLALLAVLALPGPPAAAQRTLYVSPDVPTDDPGGSGITFMPWDVLAYKAGVYSPAPVLSFPPMTAVDALHKMDKPGHWLFSVEAPTELPPGSGAWFQPDDVILFDGLVYTIWFQGAAAGLPAGVNVDAAFLFHDDSGFLVLSFDVPTTIGAVTYDPADLVQYQGGVFSIYFDASAAGSGVSTSDNLTGADDSLARPVLAMDVPSDLAPTTGPVTYLPGQIANWDGVNFNLFDSLGGWPVSSEIDALSCQGNPGRVYDRVVYQFPIILDKPSPFTGSITVNWTASCSAGAEDYGIYEGTLGSWYSHRQILCTDAGSDFTETFLPQAADSYYLVVPHNSVEEGAYGLDHDYSRIPLRIERPQPTLVADRCVATQIVTACP